jgi:hypothetical protein
MLPGWRLALALLAVCWAGCGGETGPLLQAVLPGRAPPGAPIDILGERLEGDPLFISLDGESLELLLREQKRLRARVPAAARPGQQLLVVTVDGRPSNALPFTVEDGNR